MHCLSYFSSVTKDMIISLCLAFLLQPYPEPYISCVTILNLIGIQRIWNLPENDEHTHMEQCSVYYVFTSRWGCLSCNTAKPDGNCFEQQA